jgi:hypothetical protein
MSTVALVGPAVENSRTSLESPKPAPSLAEAIPAQVRTEPVEGDDPHPLVPVFIIGGLALAGALAFLGVLLTVLALRHSGIMAP